MKKVISTAAVIALLYVATSWYIGGKAQDRYTDITQQLRNSSLGQVLQISELEYDRGLFSSQYRIEAQISPELFANLGVDPVDGGAQQWILVESGTVSHGPLLFANGFDLGWVFVRPNYQLEGGEFDQLNAILAKLNIGLLVNLSGEMNGFMVLDEYLLQLPPTEQLPTGALMVMAGFDLQFSGESDFSRIESNFKLAKFSVFSEGSGKFEIDGINGSDKSTLLSGDPASLNAIYLSDSELTIASIMFEENGVEQMAIHNMVLDVSATQPDDLEIEMGIAAENITSPMMEITQPTLRLKLEGVSLEALEAYQSLNQQNLQAILSGAQPDPALIQVQMMQVLGKFLQGKPTFTLETLSLGLPMGQVDASAEVQYIGDGMPVPGLLMAQIAARGQLSAPRVLVESQGDPQMIDALIQNGMINQNGGNLEAKFEIVDGVATVNGVPIPLFGAMPEEGDGSAP